MRGVSVGECSEVANFCVFDGAVTIGRWHAYFIHAVSVVRTHVSIDGIFGGRCPYTHPYAHAFTQICAHVYAPTFTSKKLQLGSSVNTLVVQIDIHMSVHMSVHMFVHKSTSMPVHIHLHMSMHMPIHMRLCMSQDTSLGMFCTHVLSGAAGSVVTACSAPMSASVTARPSPPTCVCTCVKHVCRCV